jgi:DNA-binding XRE family transcriptional regulator
MKCYRILRQILGFSQQTVAKAVGVSRQSISAFESGATFPSRSMCRQYDSGLDRLIDLRVMAAVEELRKESTERQDVAQ